MPTMRSAMTRTVTLLGAAAVVSLGGCNKADSNQPGDVLAQDSTLSRDLAVAGRDTTQPQLRDVPADPAPERTPQQGAERMREAPSRPGRVAVTSPTRRPRTETPPPESVPVRPPQEEPPTPVPVTTQSGNTVTQGSGSGSAAGRVGTISAGTALTLAAGQRVCTNTNSVGDRFTATLVNAVTGSNGAMIPAGATAVVEVTSLKRSDNSNDNITMGFVVRSIAFNGRSYPVSAEVTSAAVEKVRDQNSGDGRKVATGAAIGAVLGQVLGRNTKSTVIGAAGGAAGGAVIAATTAKYDGCLGTGGQIALRLTEPITVLASGD